MPYRYSVVSGIPRGLAVRKPTDVLNKGTYFNWSAGTWTTPFKPADHVRNCVGDGEQPTLCLLAVPDAALVDGVTIMEYTTNATLPILVNSFDWYAPPATPPSDVTIYVNKGSITPTGPAPARPL